MLVKKLLLPLRLVLMSPLHAELLLLVKLQPATSLTIKYLTGPVFAFSMRFSAWITRQTNPSRHG
jgi:hypothetical protein